MATLTLAGASVGVTSSSLVVSRTSSRNCKPFASQTSSRCTAAAPSLISVSCSPNWVSSPLRSSAAFSSGSFRKLAKQIKSRGTGVTIVSRAGSARCEEESKSEEKIPFGYTRKDVILIGVGLLASGIGLKYGLEAFGVDSARAGNAVQLIMVLGLTVGWISTYVFRVSSKEMTYAKQLKDYENKVMQKRLEELPEAELESMLAQIEEEKRVLRDRKNVN